MTVGLVLLEPDLGTSIIIIANSRYMYFFSGAHSRHFAMLSCDWIVSCYSCCLAPYRMHRVATFFNPAEDPLGSSYQIRQVLLAWDPEDGRESGSENRARNMNICRKQIRIRFLQLSEKKWDLLVQLELSHVSIYHLARVSDSKPVTGFICTALALGVSSWVAIQTLINLVQWLLIPLTGVPFPFISYGGSSLIILFIAMGMY